MARDSRLVRHQADRASVVAFSIEFGLNTDGGAFSQKTEAGVIQGSDGELVNTLVGIVRQRKHSRAQVDGDNSTLKRKRIPRFGENLNSGPHFGLERTIPAPARPETKPAARRAGLG